MVLVITHVTRQVLNVALEQRNIHITISLTRLVETNC